jgi:DNA repair exonuclease SbcCD ATPase subunit
MLELKKIRFKNLLSFGNDFTTIDFENKSSVLIQGSNGSGKSAAILDSLSYCLFNRPFRKINRPNLINYRNKRELVVEVWFDTAGKEYHIIRGLNPQVFEIYEDGQLISQNSAIRDYQEVLEKQILHFDFQTFTQIVVLGKATYVAFLRLQPMDRRRFIENVLNLTIFSQMSEINKLRILEVKSRYQEVKHSINLLTQEITLTTQHITEWREEAQRQQWAHEKLIDDQIDDLIRKNADAEDQKMSLTQSMIDISVDREPLQNKIDTCYDYHRQLGLKIQDTKKRITFFRDNDVCPTCEGSMLGELKHQKIYQLSQKEQELSDAQRQLTEKIDSLVNTVNVIQADFNHNSRIQNEIRLIDHTIQQNLEAVVSLERRKAEPWVQNSGKIQENEARLIELKKKENSLSDERLTLSGQLDCHEFITLMLKDTGIRSLVIRSYIPQITNTMNSYLRSLGLFIKFELNENFEEKLFARGIDELNYQSFSEGEKLRIDLAMLMTWRDLCKRRSNMNANFLIFDEILDTSIDIMGVDSLMLILNRLKEEGVKVVMISHSDNWADKFDEVWRVQKEKGFSILKSL